MEAGELTDGESSRRPRKKRIPKACGACRQSKVKCDGQRPCSRCHSLRKVSSQSSPSAAQMPIQYRSPDQIRGPENSISTHTSPATVINPPTRSLPRRPTGSSSESPNVSLLPPPPTQGHKRKRTHFEMGAVAVPDLIEAGLVTDQDATSYWAAFFSGCDRFVPVFDPRFDSMESIRSRSSLLFGAICSVGCRVVNGADSRQWHILSFQTQRMLNAAITTPTEATPETIQALLVRACYVNERSLLIAIATRMAFEVGLPEAYDVMSAHCVAKNAPRLDTIDDASQDDVVLMRKARTWLHLLVMGHILHVDAGDLPAFRFRGAARRSRILLESPCSNDMDLYLFSQVELNALRANIYSSLSQCADADEEDIMEMVRDAKIDIEVWFNDWTRIYEQRRPQMPWLQPNLIVQRHWADSMALCRAVRASGVENVRAMSQTQKTILLMAKASLRQHLEVILMEPRHYLSGLRFAMDFVWAKNAFCFLLLLKLSLLLPDDGDQQSNKDLVEKGRILLGELRNANGGRGEGSKASASSLYLQLVQASIEKYHHALQKDGGTRTGEPSLPTTIQMEQSRVDGQTELESFVPEQFVFEWDFPGLTLFSSPLTETGWLDDFLAGGLDSNDEFYGMGWASVDFSF
ncbi:hypothetical protein HYQ45_011376 [Verticillium longisporum]|uniref:Zn(2)-C6 fungal-type domain-containing protein n=1 Tax=Verticillium longisporum TaxID=100787 RepID=A0A8I2ZEM7_VERLO|nr:hypothetical protein HYQ45_011376 [Verticillium longisporum]